MGLISSLLGVGGIASNLLTNSRNQSNNDRNYDLALRQQQFVEDSFKKQMHFNSPVTQAALIHAAGFNPALGGSGLAGSVSTGSNGGMPGNTPMQSLDLGGLNGLASNISLLDSQKDNIRSSSNSNNAKAFSDKATAFNTLLRNYTQYEKDTAEIFKLKKEGKLSAEKAETEMRSRQPALDFMRSQIELNNKQQGLVEQQTQTEVERTMQQEAERKIMEFRLSKEPQRFAADLQVMVSQSAYNYAASYLQKVNAKSIEQLLPWQKQQLAVGIQETISREYLNKENAKLLGKKNESFDTDKWFERGAVILNGVTNGVIMGLGLGSFIRSGSAAVNAARAAQGQKMVEQGSKFFMNKDGVLLPKNM